jgi:hypothetical protein
MDNLVYAAMLPRIMTGVLTNSPVDVPRILAEGPRHWYNPTVGIDAVVVSRDRWDAIVSHVAFLTDTVRQWEERVSELERELQQAASA